MSFPAKINNPNPGNTPATEIQLDDRLITNSQLKDFFIEIPKRLEIVELADDTANNINVLEITNDVKKCVDDMENLKDDVQANKDNILELDSLMGERLISGTVQYWLSWFHQICDDEKLGFNARCTMLEEYNSYLDEVELENIKTKIHENAIKIADHGERLDEFETDLVTVKNKITQIDVNSAEMKVVQAQVASMQAQIEQIRTECNNRIANCFNGLEQLNEKVDLLIAKVDSL